MRADRQAPLPPDIRPLRDTDPEWISAAFAAIGWSRPRQLYDRYLAAREVAHRDVWVALLGERFAGYVTLNWRPTYAPFQAERIPEIQDLNVLPAYRRLGIGTALLDIAESRAGDSAAVVGIAVGLSSDYGSAQRLYVARGYRPDGRGIAYDYRTLRHGERTVVDDNLVLCFTKSLRK